MNSLVNELKAHQLVLVFMCAAMGTLVAFFVLSTTQALCFGLITGVFTYSLLLSRAEQENNIQFTDLEPMPPGPTEPYGTQGLGLAETPPAEAARSAELVAAPQMPAFASPNLGVAHQSSQPSVQASVPSVQADAQSVELSDAPAIVYKRKSAQCWKCGDEMYLYTWPGHAPLQVEHPPEPVPDSVQLRRSSTNPQDKYWMNTCLKCGAAQNDQAVFNEQTGQVWEDL
jgi:hypothetical protein